MLRLSSFQKTKIAALVGTILAPIRALAYNAYDLACALAEDDMNEDTKTKFGPLVVTMRVYDVATDEEIRKRTFDYNDLELRKWYGKTVIWALMNGYAIELVKADKDK